MLRGTSEVSKGPQDWIASSATLWDSPGARNPGHLQFLKLFWPSSGECSCCFLYPIPHSRKPTLSSVRSLKPPTQPASGLRGSESLQQCWRNLLEDRPRKTPQYSVSHSKDWTKTLRLCWPHLKEEMGTRQCKNSSNILKSNMVTSESSKQEDLNILTQKK